MSDGAACLCEAEAGALEGGPVLGVCGAGDEFLVGAGWMDEVDWREGNALDDVVVDDGAEFC